MIGQTLKDTYKLYDKVGSGGFATVYLGRNVRSNQIVAVKVLREESAEVPGMVTRFRREAQMIQGLDHPNLVRVLDYGVEDGRHFLVLDYVQGKTLAQIIAEQGPLPVEQAMSYVSQICGVLAHAHQHGIVHRDIKPGNLMVTPDGTVKVMDFGIAKIAAITALTHSGQSMGTPRYMSPEMAKGEPVDIRSDIYALGVVLYEMLAGKAPFDADSPWTVMRQHIETPPRSLAELRRGLPAWLEAVVMRALAKDPAARFQTPAEMAAALEAPVAHPTQMALVAPTQTRSSRPGTPVPLPNVTNLPAENVSTVPAPDTQLAMHKMSPPLWIIGAGMGMIVLGLIGALVFGSDLLPAGNPTPPLVASAPTATAQVVQPTATLAPVATTTQSNRPSLIASPLAAGTQTPEATVTLVPTATLAPTALQLQGPRSAPTVRAEPTTPITLKILTTQRSWLRVTVDGQMSEEGMLNANQSRTWYADESIAIRTGNAGGVILNLNGQNLGTMGTEGEVVERAWAVERGRVIETAAGSVAAAVPTATRPLSANSTRTPSPLEQRAPMPTLGDPSGATEPGPNIVFNWSMAGYTLRPGEGYAVMAWKADDPRYQGKKGLDLPTLFAACDSPPHTEMKWTSNFGATVGRAGPGAYLWTVVVVDTLLTDANGRCVVISDQPVPHRFTYLGGQPSKQVLATPVPLPPEDPTPASP